MVIHFKSSQSAMCAKEKRVPPDRRAPTDRRDDGVQAAGQVGAAPAVGGWRGRLRQSAAQLSEQRPDARLLHLQLARVVESPQRRHHVSGLLVRLRRRDTPEPRGRTATLTTLGHRSAIRNTRGNKHEQC